MQSALTKTSHTVYPISVPTKHSLQSFNFYLLQEEDSLSLIDAGMNNEENWNDLTRTLHNFGFSLEDVSRIIITHNHEDHVGLVNRISSIKKDIPIYAPKEAIHRLKRDPQFFKMRIAFFKQLYEEMGCGIFGEKQVGRLIAAANQHEKRRVDADIIPLTEADLIAGLQAIQTPGHSPDHMIFFDEKRKWIFGGDLLIQHISSNALVEPDEDGKRLLTLIQHENSLKKCLALEADVLFPGHGELIFDYKKLITERLNGIQKKADRMLKLIEKGVTTANELAQTYYKHKYESQFSLVMSEIIGHLDYLENHQKVTKELKDGVWHYYSEVK
ncbi:MBL fold metallo-hydrolase [Bacillus taeanensis]|uniref:MBL fold metallo-hydrolase n=1 Tax=Bacillus taeanensis TaxID=273032 RepID=A0A366XWS9_9BACI|nr:MBL fold metallo-hydrolase [Bacillus taeanensis]RBW70096.1 MBL fold metallo-hydrolase [Bacillus taeanensis]